MSLGQSHESPPSSPAHAALRYLAARCDGARALDGQGFNGRDSDFGKSMANALRLTERQEVYAIKFVRKYQRQLREGGFDIESIISETQRMRQQKDQVKDESVGGRLIDLEGEMFVITTPGYIESVVKAIRQVPDRRYDGVNKRNLVPIDRCLEVEKFGMENGFTFTPFAQAIIVEQREMAEAERRRVADAIAASTAEHSDIELKVKGLYPFQKAGVEYALDRRRTFLSEEMGLGKSVESLAVIEEDDAYPVLIACPKSVVLNWRKESLKWLPHRTVQIVDSNSMMGIADITIINYEAVDKRLEGLLFFFKSLICDESHRLKGKDAKVTRATQLLADKLVDKDPIILLLSGTPLINRPVELVTQLKIMRRLEEFGGFHAFSKRYCVGGGQNLNELNFQLRASCMRRVLKKDVLTELPFKTWTNVPVSLSNESEYRFAERQFLAWVRESGGDVFKAMRAETLTRLNALRRLAAQGKLEDSIEWIKDFLDEGLQGMGTDEADGKLVVFAHHKDVQNALLAQLQEYNPRTIRSEDSIEQREASVEAFQTDDSVRVIICSLKAGGIGITLTAASNVAFLELDWTPAGMNQSLDRSHRIGQKDAVTGWRLVAPFSIDDFMADLLDEKQLISDQTLDGTASADQEEDMVTQLIDRMMGRVY